MTDTEAVQAEAHSLIKDTTKIETTEINTTNGNEPIVSDANAASASNGMDESTQGSTISAAESGMGDNSTAAESTDDATQDYETSAAGNKRSAEASQYWDLVDKNRQDFNSWTQLISVVEREGAVEGVQEVYNEFLIYYPYCYGYWKKYADWMAENVSKEEAQKIYEDAVMAVGLSVDLWISYIEFCVVKGDSAEQLRILYERALESCGMEFRSDALWEKYIEWEAENTNWRNITHIYRRLLTIPTKCYTIHYDNLKAHIEAHELTEILTAEELAQAKVKAEKALANEEVVEKEEVPSSTDGSADTEADSSKDCTELSDAVKRAIKVFLFDEFHAFYTHIEKEIAKRWSYEEAIRRPYFHTKALDAAQLKNWRDYLEFEISEADDSRIVTLFERCLIACAQYEEFWLRYTSYLEGTQRHTDVRNVYMRSCRQHLPYKASIHINWAFYEERQGNFDAAKEVIENIEVQAPDNMCVINHKLNLFRRHGLDLCELYQQYVEHKALSTESIQLLISKYVRYLHKIKGDEEKAVQVLSKAIQEHSACELFYTQLLDIEYQRFPLNEEKIIAVFDLVTNSALPSDTKEKFYSRRYEFIDDFGADVNRLYSLYQKHESSQSGEGKKRQLQDSDSTHDESKKAKLDTPAVTSTAVANGAEVSAADTTTASTYQAAGDYSSAYPGYPPAANAAQYPAGQYDWSQYYNQAGYTGQYPGYPPQGYGYTGYDYSTGYYQ